MGDTVLPHARKKAAVARTGGASYIGNIIKESSRRGAMEEWSIKREQENAKGLINF